MIVSHVGDSDLEYFHENPLPHGPNWLMMEAVIYISDQVPKINDHWPNYEIDQWVWYQQEAIVLLLECCEIDLSSVMDRVHSDWLYTNFDGIGPNGN